MKVSGRFITPLAAATLLVPLKAGYREGVESVRSASLSGTRPSVNLMRPYLMLAIAVEKGHVENVTRFATQLGYGLDAVESATIEALTWAEEAVSQAG